MVKFYASWIVFLVTLPLYHFWTPQQGTFKFLLSNQRILIASAFPFSARFVQAQQFQANRPSQMSQADMELPIKTDFATEEDQEIYRILSTANVIAVVGATNRESMPVYGVMRYLQNQVGISKKKTRYLCFYRSSTSVKWMLAACALNFGLVTGVSLYSREPRRRSQRGEHPWGAGRRAHQ